MKRIQIRIDFQITPDLAEILPWGQEGISSQISNGGAMSIFLTRHHYIAVRVAYQRRTLRGYRNTVVQTYHTLRQTSLGYSIGELIHPTNPTPLALVRDPDPEGPHVLH